MRKTHPFLLIGIFLIGTLGFLLATNKTAEARRGCCSHHGGVCGCRCCDGTPLSAKCAPYYPDCSDSSPSYIQGYQAEKYEASASAQNEKKELVYVGSVSSNKYHYSWCRWAKRIKPENLIAFSSAKDARSKGYVPCKVCNPPLRDKE